MNNDIRYNPLSGANAEQAARYNNLLQDYIEYRASVFKDLKQLCHEAPQFAMAQLFKAYMLLSMGTLSTVDAAKKCAEEVQQNTPTLCEQEQQHISAVIAWSKGDTEGAVNIWEKIILTSPLDLLAMKLHHFALFWLGQPDRMLSVCNKVRTHWNQGTPGYANFLGLLAFAHEELGNYAESEKLSRDAVERNPDDLWSLHALVHTLEMQGRLDEGIALLDAPVDRYDDRNPFRGHLWWHLGMFLVEKGQFDQAIEIYDAAIYADQSSFYLDLQNTASILARLELCGIDVGDRWLNLGEAVKTRQGDHVLAFTEPHHTMVLARCGEFDEIERQLSSLEKVTLDADHALAKLVKPIVVPLCQAIRDFYLLSTQKTDGSLANLESNLTAIGGSHAQRDLFQLLHIQGVINRKDFAAAKQLLEPRLKLRPNSTINWHQYANVCQRLGDDSAVHIAQNELQRISRTVST